MAVLVVDDDENLREAIERALEVNGYRVVCAADGHEALRLLRAQNDPPCLVLLDLMMPGMNGWHLLEIIARDRDLQGIPVVTMSAHVRAHQERLGMSLPEGDFLEKPIELGTLLSIVEQHCSRPF
jgi:two-component system alkaline phosphatase synthesis response regulator PhoP